MSFPVYMILNYMSEAIISGATIMWSLCALAAEGGKYGIPRVRKVQQHV